LSLEQIVLSNLIYNEEYGRKVIPFLKSEYFEDYSEKVLFEIINDYVEKYSSFPTKEAVAIELSNRDNIDETVFKSSKEIIQRLERSDSQLEWLVDKTEKFCQDRALYLAIQQSVKIYGSKEGSISRGGIPDLLNEALGVSFDTNIGHDFLADFEARYDYYHHTENRIPFDIDYLNRITKGGLPPKTLNVILGGTGFGKTLFMCHMSAANLAAGKNVLYITMEMSEYRIAERIDANLLNVTLDDLQLLPRAQYMQKVEKLKDKAKGRLIIKEYPTSCAGAANFRHLLHELSIKKNFVPDIIYIDYLNICMSSRVRFGTNVNSYSYIKAIAEEFRGLAVENNVPIVTATQTNRSGFTNSDVGLEDTSESFGLPATADLMIAVINSEELSNLKQILVKQLKNRYSDIGINTRFVIGIDRSKMRLYDLDESAQEGITGANTDNKPVFDKSKFGQEEEERSKPRKFDMNKFKDFK